MTSKPSLNYVDACLMASRAEEEGDAFFFECILTSMQKMKPETRMYFRHKLHEITFKYTFPKAYKQHYLNASAQNLNDAAVRVKCEPAIHNEEPIDQRHLQAEPIPSCSAYDASNYGLLQQLMTIAQQIEKSSATTNTAVPAAKIKQESTENTNSSAVQGSAAPASPAPPVPSAAGQSASGASSKPGIVVASIKELLIDIINAGQQAEETTQIATEAVVDAQNIAISSPAVQTTTDKVDIKEENVESRRRRPVSNGKPMEMIDLTD